MSATPVVSDETLQLRLKAMHLPSFLDHYIEPIGRQQSRCWRT